MHLLLLLCALALGATSLPAGPAPADDVSGEWKGEIATRVSYSPLPLYFKLQQNGDVVSGTAGPAAASQHPIHDVKRTGRTLHFSVSAEALTYTFDLIVAGDTLQGTASGEDHQDHTWTGEASLTRVTTTQH